MMLRAAVVLLIGVASLGITGSAQAYVVLGEMGIDEDGNGVNTANYDVVKCDPCYIPFRLEDPNDLTAFAFNAGIAAKTKDGFALNPVDFSIRPFTNGKPPTVGAALSSTLYTNPPSGFGNGDVVRAFTDVAANQLFAFAFSGAGGKLGGKEDAQTKLRITLTSVVPLPAAAPLFLSALGGLWGVRRWRAKAASPGLAPAR